MFRDPFGLEITVIGQQLASIVQMLMNSPTFAAMYNSLDAKPAKDVDYRMEESTREAVLKFGGNTDVFSGIGHTLVNPWNHRGTTLIAGESLSEQKVIHEFVHAAGAYAKQADTGVPLRCETHNGWSKECDNVADKIAKEMEAWRKEQSNK